MREPTPADPGLCGRCRHAGCQKSAKGSSFLRCGLADEREEFRRYPPLPVLRCAGFAPDESPDADDPDIG